MAPFFAVAAIAASRLWLARVLPLTDTTEARFAEMARKMVETGSWLTPQHDYGVPYLGKPPLAVWFSAIGIEIFGAGEFGPRCLILASTLAFCALFYSWAKAELGARRAALALIALMSSVLFFTATAAVMTDMILTIFLTIALLAFWRRFHGGPGGWELAMYLALGLGLLAKGPLITVLFATPVVAWSTAHRHWGNVGRRFSWRKGFLLTVAVAIPWYIAAERANPGFLSYFLLGEHLQRFLVPGWSGDLYGRAHQVPHGTIWLYFLIGALPWTLVAIPALIRNRPALERNWRADRELIWFLAAAAVSPLVLFTFSSNVIVPYALPAMPMVVLATVALAANVDAPQSALILPAGLATATVAAVALAVAAFAPQINRHSQRSVIEAIRSSPDATASRIYYWQERYFSADYYSAGATSVITDAATLRRTLSMPEPLYLVVREKRRRELPPDILSKLVFRSSTQGFAVFERGTAEGHAEIALP